MNQKTKLIRVLEILPGFVSWFLILFPFWGSFIIPTIVAYYIITFDVYWLYRSLFMGIGATISHFRIKATQKYDWMEDVNDFGDWQKVQHIIILPTYKEPIYIIKRSLDALKEQIFPLKNLHIFLAFEEREGDSAKEKAKLLKQEYEKYFGTFACSFHPVLPNEVIGKSSNMAWAGKMAKQIVVDQKKNDIKYCTITSEDVDARFHRKHFANLTYKFLDDPQRYYKFWQPAIMYYNNIWEIPIPIRVFSTTASITQISMLNRKDKLINFSTYSTSLKLIDSIGYWDTDVIPEDYRIFFKSYFKTNGKANVEPIFLPVFADAANAGNFWKTMINQYEQVKRWAWGTSDDPWIIQEWLKAKNIPFWDKTLRVLKVLEDHFLWPVNWFAITIGATLPPLLNPEFARTVLGKSLPQTSSTILTISLLSLIVTIFIDYKQRPDKKNVALWKKIITPFEFFLLPVVGFFFSALPGIDAHTRLMLGKYLEYRTTEKV
ncbi:hypothetical protein GYA19_02340 [Candidatus Beckwithbacteria bacterium]|nr:hypothetical protein [Candidatus Beckwithbacteria bacterium]